MRSSLELFSAPVVRWFRNSFGAPTAPQEEGWPHIARSENTLILAPTGSGKTLAAFLWLIDDLATRSAGARSHGVRAVYVSPLRALAADVERNLATPLREIRACGEEMGIPVADVRVGVRTGDTSPADRQRMLRHPPDLLITTPESLHLLLTARRSREMLRDVRYVIVDEIHTVCGEKRGTFLALVLERLEHLAGRPVVRIGLSATQRPLERVARFLGGYDSEGKPRPVAIVDCGGRKDIDLAVIAPVPDMRLLLQVDGQVPSVWPAIYDRLLELTRAHTTTLIFANNRRAVERIAAEMNRRAGRRLVRAHHGSVAKEYRQEIEGELKAGRLPALVATASLELGIDMGAIDLVCQVETPTSVASGLQRVGRAGHVVHRVSVGRMIPKTRSDLLRMACMSRAMLRGDISAVRVPENPLDVLAQQVIAIVATGDWLADDLYRCVRRADPFHDLPRSSFDAVLEMVSGEYQTPAFPGLRARILWEKGAGRLSALPGALHAAISAGGTIPDTGQYAMVLEDGKTRLGELDEEFVFERRVGDTFVLGTGRWRILDIRHDRVVVSPSAMEEAQLPFWKGEGLGHDAEFGERLGAFAAECRGRSREGDLAPWLERECALDPDAARILAEFVAEQAASGGLPDDRTVLVDVFPNETGDLRASIVSTFGRSFHLALWLALRAEVRRAGREPLEGIVSNDGILLRLGSLSPSNLVGALESLRDGRIRDRLLEELRDSPYFALRFRRNAGRALLLPRSQPGKRMPLWLQRLRSHDLLSYASEHARFPIVLETYREILDDVLPVAALESFARRLANGETRFLERRSPTPSPLSAALLLDFLGKYMYEADRPVAQPARVDDHLLDDLLGQEGAADRVSDDAIRTMEERLQCLSAFHRARTAAESVALLHRLGDLTRDELLARCEPEAAAAIPELEREGRIRCIAPPLTGEERLVAADAALDYAGEPPDEERVLVRFLSTHAGRTEGEVRRRYPGARIALDAILARGVIVRVDLPGKPGALLDRDVLAGMRRMTMGERRRVASPVSGAALAAAVLRRQHVTSGLAGIDGLRGVLEQLAGWLAPVAVWPEILDARLTDAGRPRLEVLVRGGVVEWRGARRGGTRLLGFAPAGTAIDLLPRPAEEPGALAGEVLAYLSACGASFLHQISLGLDRAPAAIDEALWDLTWSGSVTNDSLVAALRPGPGRARPTPAVGRWSRVSAEEAADPAEREAARLRVLLHRYGFLSREMLDHDTMDLRWSDAYPVLSRMEWRGDVERGIFVSGLSGPQFAAPGMDADMRRAPEGGGACLLCAIDPACVFFGADVDGMPRKAPGGYVVVQDGRPLLSIEASAGRLTPLADLTSGERRAALALVPNLVRRVGQRPSIRFGWWGEASIVDSEAAADLAALGFLRDDRSMILYRSFGGSAMTREVLAQVASTAADILSAGPICDACLGGAFGRLGHGLTNEERARSLRGVAALVGERGRPGPCWVCGGVFGGAESWAARARAEVGEIEFATYLCAVRPSLRWQEAERLLVERFHLAHAEPQKHAWNRAVGKAFERLAGHGTVDFSDPDVKFTIDPAAGTIEIDIASVFVYGRYRKLERGIPQTHWPCRRCRGRGCAECGGTGKQYADSVEELVAAPFVQACHASGAILHGAGRGDIDARMLGSGRPFVLEIVRPHVRSIDARALGGEVNAAARGRVEVSNLRLCRRDAVGIVKETDAGKTYRAKVEFEKDVSPAALVAALGSLVGDIAQRTPRRVAHRRADLVRTRRLRAASVTRSELREAEIEMVTDGGLYVKELVSGDEGRTEPSLAGRLGTAAVVRELDVLDISSDGFPDAEEVARGEEVRAENEMDSRSGLA